MSLECLSLVPIDESDPQSIMSADRSLETA